MARYTKGGDVVRVPQINSELEQVETSMGDMLSRKGDAPNQMEALLDMNGHKIINVQTDASDPDSLVVRGNVYVKDEVDSRDTATLSSANQYASSQDAATLALAKQYADAGNTATKYVQETVPLTGLFQGNRWYKPSEATTYVYYEDGDSGQWVEESGVSVGTGAIYKTTTDLVVEANAFPIGFVLRTTGYSVQGGVGAASWIKTSEIDTPSSLPTERLDGTITDLNGNVWRVSREEFLTPEVFGAVGDGVADDGLAVKTLFASCKYILIMSDYFMDSPSYDATSDWRIHCEVSEGTVVLGKGKLICNTPFAQRAVALSVLGSNVSIEGITIEDQYNVASPFLVGVGIGSSYDSRFNFNIDNIYINNCSFYNNWLSISAQMLTNTGSIRKVNVTNCKSIGLITSGSGGNFNFRAPLNEFPISDIYVAFCSAENGTTASSYNFYSIDKFKVIGCTSKFNRYAGAEAENGSRKGQFIGFDSYDDCYGIWVDDSRDIQINNLTHETVTSNYVTPLLGTLGLVRNAVRITKQGFENNLSYQTTNIQLDGVLTKNGSFFSGVFGANPQGDMGRLYILNWLARSDGISGAVGFSAGGGYEALTLRNIDVAGFTDTCVDISSSSGSRTYADDIKTFPVIGENSTGISFVGSGKLFLDGAYVHSESILRVGNEIRSLVVDNIVTTERINDQSFLYAFTGSPEGVVEAGQGSMVYRSDDGAVYVKSSGVGSTGWSRLSTL